MQTTDLEDLVHIGISLNNFKVCHPRCVCNSLGGRRIVKTTQLISCVVLTILLPRNDQFKCCQIYILLRDSGGKVNSFGGDSIGHCEKKSSYDHVSNSERLPAQNCLNLQA